MTWLAWRRHRAHWQIALALLAPGRAATGLMIGEEQ
jgi:hypothetical protein